MPQIRFKPRNGGKTVQLVRHVYCPKAKRSRTLTIGSLRRDTDPDEVCFGIRLADGQRLDGADLACVREWLQHHGDPEAARRRSERLQKLELTIRERIARESLGGAGDTILERTAEGLAHAAVALETLAREAALRQERPRDLLRSGYLKIYRAWEQFAAVAKKAGVAKRIDRGPKLQDDAAETHEDPIGQLTEGPTRSSERARSSAS